MRLPELSYANVMATVATFLALGGTSYAVARNSIGTPQLKSNAVTSAKIRNGTVGRADVSASLRNGARGPRGAQGPAGPIGSTGAIGPRGPSQARVAQRQDTILLSRTALVPTTLVSLADLEPGAYVFQFDGDAFYRPASTHALYVICQLLINGQPVGASTRTIAGEAPSANGTPGVNFLHAVTRGDRFSAAVTCQSDQSAPQAATPAIERPVLAAIRLDSVTVSE